MICWQSLTASVPKLRLALQSHQHEPLDKVNHPNPLRPNKIYLQSSVISLSRPASRPGTPSLKPNPTIGGSRSPVRGSTATPPGRSSEEKSNSGGQRKSGDSTRSLHQTFTPATTTTEESPEPTPQAAPVKSGGGWWGSILSTATAAVTQAQAAVQEIQKNEEAQKYLEQVRGNVGAIRGFGRSPMAQGDSNTNVSSRRGVAINGNAPPSRTSCRPLLPPYHLMSASRSTLPMI